MYPRARYSCLFLVLVLAAMPLMAAAPAVHDVTGATHGFFQSAVTGQVGTFKVEVDWQQNRRFMGTFHYPHPAIAPVMTVIPVEETLSASLNLNVGGRAPGWMIVSNSKANPNGDGTAWARGDYSFKWPFTPSAMCRPCSAAMCA